MSSSNLDENQQNFEPSGSPIGEYLSEIIRLPGFWSAAEECEAIKPTGFCERGHIQFGSENPCGTRTCPHHWGQARKRAAVNLVARLAAYRAVQGDRWSKMRRMLHVVSSPDQEQRWTVNRFWDHRSDSYEPVEAAGGRGGATIPHPYGVSEQGNREFYKAIAHGLDPEYGKWRFLRDLADDWEEMQVFVDVHPHFHQFVPCADFDAEAAEEIEAETGWMVQNIRPLEAFYIDANDALPALSREERKRARKSEKGEFEALKDVAMDKALAGYEDMARLAMYLLSHAAVQPETGDLSMRQTVTYWGEVSSFNPEEELSREKWETIRRYAKAAVGAGASELEEPGEGQGEGICAREDCEAPIHPVTDLKDWLGDPDHSWWDSLPHERQLELLGLKKSLSDRPPPAVGGANPQDMYAHPEEVPEELPENGEQPPGGFARSPDTPPGVETREEYLEWLRGLGRSVVDSCKYPFLTVGMDTSTIAD